MKQENLLVILIYTFALLVMVYYQNIAASIFVLLVLLSYHVISMYSTHQHFLSEQEIETSKLKLKLDKTKRMTDETHSQLVSLLEVLGSGVLLIDEEGLIKLYNEDFAKLFHHEELVFKHYEGLKTEEPLYKVIHEAYLTERKIRKQIHIKAHYYDVVSTPIVEDKQYLGCMIVVHDITALKTAEQFQKQFSADVSHELKTPLSAIKGLSEILSRDEAMDAKERQDFFSMILTEASRLETILNDLLIISKMDRIDYELSRETVSMKRLIEDVVNLLKPQAKNKDLELTAEIHDFNLYVDGVKMKQVVMNLIRNAINYTDEGYVHIKSSFDKEHFYIEVSDTGIGIDDKEKENVFKRFYRVDAARSRDTGGSGLGLSIIKNVVKKHGGSLLLDSTLHKGSTFTVVLPINHEKQ